MECKARVNDTLNALIILAFVCCFYTCAQYKWPGTFRKLIGDAYYAVFVLGFVIGAWFHSMMVAIALKSDLKFC